MYKEKYKKYKLKYKLLQKNIAKYGIMNGGDRFSESKHFNSNLNFIVKLLNDNYGSDWAFTGSTAVILLAKDLDILEKFPELNFPNDYDVLIQNNSPIITNKLGNLEKIPEQRDKIIKSVTFAGYANNDPSDETNKVSLDITFLDRTVKIKMYNLSTNSLRTVDPFAICSSYEDDLMMGTSKNPASDAIKKRVLDEVIKIKLSKEVDSPKISKRMRKYEYDSDSAPIKKSLFADD
jgi:hypothetical protein